MKMDINPNYSKLKLSVFYLPLALIAVFVIFLFKMEALTVDSYIKVQQDWFFFLNSKLSQYPITQHNLTQMGDALIFLSILSLLIIYVPRVWVALISASLVSLIFSNLLKHFFAVPRPAAVFDNRDFTIIGKTLTGYNSTPSGHSITVFTILTVLLFAFMPKEIKNKIVWCFSIITVGLILVFTRVGVGAHYPLDVISGSLVGYISALAGIFISQKYAFWNWIPNKKYYPIFMLLFLSCSIALINKIAYENLTIFYFSILSLIITQYKIITIYVKK
jgi:membrane-associated phospholipid phosphatase